MAPHGGRCARRDGRPTGVSHDDRGHGAARDRLGPGRRTDGGEGPVAPLLRSKSDDEGCSRASPHARTPCGELLVRRLPSGPRRRAGCHQRSAMSVPPSRGGPGLDTRSSRRYKCKPYRMRGGPRTTRIVGPNHGDANDLHEVRERGGRDGMCPVRSGSLVQSNGTKTGTGRALVKTDLSQHGGKEANWRLPSLNRLSAGPRQCVTPRRPAPSPPPPRSHAGVPRRRPPAAPARGSRAAGAPRPWRGRTGSSNQRPSSPPGPSGR